MPSFETLLAYCSADGFMMKNKQAFPYPQDDSDTYDKRGVFGHGSMMKESCLAQPRPGPQKPVQYHFVDNLTYF